MWGKYGVFALWFILTDRESDFRGCVFERDSDFRFRRFRTNLKSKVLPDYERRAQSWAGGDSNGNAELVADRQWFSSQIRVFLSGAAEDFQKPTKRHRLAMVRFLTALDASMRHVAGFGWERFRTAGASLRADAVKKLGEAGLPPADAERPTCTIVVDQHSVGWSAQFALCHKLKLRTSFVMDPSHRFARDIELALKACNLWYTILLLNIPFNVNYGPWEGCAFWRQCLSAMSSFVSEVGHVKCPLFQAYLPQIAIGKGRAVRRARP